MNYTVHITSQAERDLDGIIAYLMGRFSSPTAAKSALDEFGSLVATLAITPELHAHVRDPLLRQVGYRWAPVSTYMVFYTIDKEEPAVYIERVLHNSRNWREII